MSLLALPHGLHRNVSEREYHARVRGLVSKSALDLVHRSPAHYAAWLAGAEQESSPAMTFGSAFHAALLEPERFARDFIAEPSFGDCRKTANRAARDEWRAANGTKTQVDPADMARIRAMMASVRAHPLASRMIHDGDAEATLRWKDGITGLECKARVDYYVPRLGMVADVKTSEDARPDAFRKSVANYGYHRQDAFYRSAFTAVGAAVEHFVFVVVEKQAPHAVAVYALDQEAVTRGFASVRADMAVLAECLRTDKFPGYETSIQTLSVPPWAA